MFIEILLFNIWWKIIRFYICILGEIKIFFFILYILGY